MIWVLGKFLDEKNKFWTLGSQEFLLNAYPDASGSVEIGPESKRVGLRAVILYLPTYLPTYLYIYIYSI